MSTDDASLSPWCLGLVSVLSWSCLCLVSVLFWRCLCDVSVMSRTSKKLHKVNHHLVRLLMVQKSGQPNLVMYEIPWNISKYSSKNCQTLPSTKGLCLRPIPPEALEMDAPNDFPYRVLVHWDVGQGSLYDPPWNEQPISGPLKIGQFRPWKPGDSPNLIKPSFLGVICQW